MWIWCRLYEERYVLLSSSDMLPSGASTLAWPDAAQLPLALLTAEMRDRQIIDQAFADHGITVAPQVETDSVASLLAQVATGNWACIVPHTWLWTSPLEGDIRAVEMVDPGTEGPDSASHQLRRARIANCPGAEHICPAAEAERVLRCAVTRDYASALTGACGVAALVGLRLARCPLSTPAAGSSSQSMIDGPPDASASVSADCNSDGVVT